VIYLRVSEQVQSASEARWQPNYLLRLQPGDSDAGGIYEYDVAAILLSRLLRGVSVPVGIHAPVVRIAFQQSNEGYPLDDVVAWGTPNHLTRSRAFRSR
jgi:hypothetical protein